MSNENAALVLKWVMESLEENRKEADDEMQSNKADAFAAGRALAYAEVIDIIHNRIDSVESLE